MPHLVQREDLVAHQKGQLVGEFKDREGNILELSEVLPRPMTSACVHPAHSAPERLTRRRTAGAAPRLG